MLWYRLDLTGPRPRLSLRIVRPARSMTLFLPDAPAGAPGWADRFTFLGARSPLGPVAIAASAARRTPHLTVEPGEVAWVELSYEIDAPLSSEARDLGTPFFDPRRGALAWMPSLLLLPSRAASRTLSAIPFEVRAPASWRVASSWGEPDAERAEAGARTAGWVVEDVGALRDAFVWAAPGAARAERREGIAVHFDPRFEGPEREHAALIERTVRELRARYGALGEVDALVLAGQRRDGAGRRGGFVLRLERDARPDPGLEALVAHEALHLWNGHATHPVAEDRARALWFQEGLTHWLALEALVARGTWTERARDAEISAAAARLLAAPAGAPRRPYDEGFLFAARAACRAPQAPGAWLIALLARAGDRPYRAEELSDAAAEVGALGADFAREVGAFTRAGPSARARAVRARAIVGGGAGAACGKD